MAAVEIGKLCVKLTGRDAGRECLVVKKLDNSMVLIDGNTRRRKCNTHHLEFLGRRAKIKEGADHEEVVKALQDLGIRILPKSSPREKKPRVGAKSAAEEPKKEKKLKLPKLRVEKPKKAEKGA